MARVAFIALAVLLLAGCGPTPHETAADTCSVRGGIVSISETNLRHLRCEDGSVWIGWASAIDSGWDLETGPKR